MFLIVSDRRPFSEMWRVLLSHFLANGDKSETLHDLKAAVTTAENNCLTLVVVDGSQLGSKVLQPGGELARLAKRTRLLLVESNLLPNAEIMALALGVAGCCSAQLSETELKRIVDVVLKGGVWISRQALPDMLNHLRQANVHSIENQTTDKLGNLTSREREIAFYVAEGSTNKRIAKHLGVSDLTIKAHLTVVFRKLGVSSRVQLALMLSSQHQPESLSA